MQTVRLPFQLPLLKQVIDWDEKAAPVPLSLEEGASSGECLPAKLRVLHTEGSSGGSY